MCFCALMSCEGGSSAGREEQGPQQMGHLSLREPTEKDQFIHCIRQSKIIDIEGKFSVHHTTNIYRQSLGISSGM